jgi:hypothetical protein
LDGDHPVRVTRAFLHRTDNPMGRLFAGTSPSTLSALAAAAVAVAAQEITLWLANFNTTTFAARWRRCITPQG